MHRQLDLADIGTGEHRVSVRWRLGVLAVQLFVLALGTYLIEGSVVVATTWYAAGLLAIAINPQLLEPRYPRPGDVVGNALLGLAIIYVSPKEHAGVGWALAAALMSVAGLIGLAALVMGAGREDGSLQRIGRAARQASELATAKLLYSTLFWLDVLEREPDAGARFWALGALWFALMVTGAPNWQSMWSTATAGPAPARVEGIIAPARLVISSPTLAAVGSWVQLAARGTSTTGTVITRIPRPGDFWGEVHVTSSASAERLLAAGMIDVRSFESDEEIVGSVDVGSTERLLGFIAARPLEVGAVVRVRSGDAHVLYQVISGSIDLSTAKGGGQLVVRTVAQQVGKLQERQVALTRHRWVPDPGAAVLSGVGEQPGAPEIPENSALIGHIVGTKVPVVMDLRGMSEGHLGILGMTKMGKTSLAVRIATKLAEQRRVVVLDQSGEYRKRRGYPEYKGDEEWKSAGISVREPTPPQVPPSFAFVVLKETVKLALTEYEGDKIVPRTLLVDEAHQFVPEPSGLGFGSPGRDDAYNFGVLVMQVRKYGISLLLVSQRTAVISKSALSQCENLIAFRSVDQTGLEYLEAIAGPVVRLVLPNLRQGEALVFGPAFSSENPVVVTVPRE